MRTACIEVGTPQEIRDRPRSTFVYEFLGNVNKLDDGPGPSYIRLHEIEVVFAAEYDPATDRLACGQHLFSACQIATLSCRLSDGQFVEVELSSKQLEELASSEGEEIAVRF